MVTNSSRNNWLRIGFTVLVVIVVIIFIYRFSKQRNKINEGRQSSSSSSAQTITNKPLENNNTISSWKVYKDNIDKWEVKYPADWHVLPKVGPVTSFTVSNEDGGKAPITVSIFKNTDVSAETLESRKKYFAGKPNDFQVLEDISVNGKSGFEIKFLKVNQREAIISKDLSKSSQILFTIFVIYNKAYEKNALSIYKKMLSTFKLLD